MYSNRTTFADTVMSMAGRSKVQATIRLHDRHDAYLHSYTTLDNVEGELCVTASRDTPFDDVEIKLEGCAKTWVEKLAPSVAAAAQRQDAMHIFLEMTQPLEAEQYPSPRILRTGKTYTFPFTFVIPPRLIQRCGHAASDQIRDHHSMLPPSFGDPGMSGDGQALQDDLAPSMAKVWYAVSATVRRRRESGGNPLKLAETIQKIRVLPAYDEQAPIEAAFKPCDYNMRREKNLRKGMLQGKLGRVTMQAAQPRSMPLPPPPPHAVPPCPATTMATVNLRFDPAHADTAPPRLGQLTTKMRVNTFYGTKGMGDFPVRSTALTDGNRGMYSETVPLATRCVQLAQWEEHTGSDDRTGSVDSTLSTASKSPGVGKYYTARLLVPVTLPKDKFFPPTFFSCLVARIYQLEISLSMHTPGIRAVAPTFQLLVPLQISSTGRLDRQDTGAAVEDDADPLVPRSIAPPSEAYQRTSSLPTSPTDLPPPPPQLDGASTPPGYSYFGAGVGPGRIPSPIGVSASCG